MNYELPATASCWSRYWSFRLLSGEFYSLSCIELLALSELVGDDPPSGCPHVYLTGCAECLLCGQVRNQRMTSCSQCEETGSSYALRQADHVDLLLDRRGRRGLRDQ